MYFIMILLLSCIILQCKRFLPPGEKLYKGATVMVQKNPEVKKIKQAIKANI